MVLFGCKKTDILKSISVSINKTNQKIFYLIMATLPLFVMFPLTLQPASIV